jgi:hypothetical protein
LAGLIGANEATQKEQNLNAKIERKTGLTPTEKFLSDICDHTFLKLWVYPNTYFKIGKEFCDVLVIFENDVFIFSVKDIAFNQGKHVDVGWTRWRRKAIDDSIKQVDGAASWINKFPDRIFLDPKCTVDLPVKMPKNPTVHRIIVAYGAETACKAESPNNIHGSLAVSYSNNPGIFVGDGFNFNLSLPRNPVYHVFDSFNLAIVLGELDTISDFANYLKSKEAAVSKYIMITYCGEEDLLAHYFFNFDEKVGEHFIGSSEANLLGLMVPEGEWEQLKRHDFYKRRKKANASSYLWDEIIQSASQHAFDGKLTGASAFAPNSPFLEMAKEPRFVRRENSLAIIESVKKFPFSGDKRVRMISTYPSIDDQKRYVFLQINPPSADIDYESVHRPKRKRMVEIACGVLKSKHKNLRKIIGVAYDAPKYSKSNSSKDFLYFDCGLWDAEKEDHYRAANQDFGFFEQPTRDVGFVNAQEFPDGSDKNVSAKLGRNEKCPCGSGKKFKKCCLIWMK